MCLGFLAAACSTNNELASPEAAAVIQEDCVIRPGDVCRIMLFGLEDLSRVYVVDSSGRIDLGNVEMSLNGLTCDEAEQSILEAEQSILEMAPLEMAPKSGQVGVECFRNRPVCIIGEVANAGCFPYVRGMRVCQITAMACGFTYRAVEDEFIISRNGQQFQAGPETLVMPGDVIEVRERFF